MSPALVLASQSPRRRELLERAGFHFVVRPPSVEEQRLADEHPADYVERLAREKASAAEAASDEWVLAADTTVVLDEHVLEKPSSTEDAARMLRLLAGRAHEVLTGICVRRGERLWSAVEATRVVFAEMSEAEVAGYVASGEPMDKAGAYAIQGLASRFIPRIEGCYYNVMGLPVARVCAMLRQAGYRPDFG